MLVRGLKKNINFLLDKNDDQQLRPESDCHQVGNADGVQLPSTEH